jgi:hypothetical protein
MLCALHISSLAAAAASVAAAPTTGCLNDCAQYGVGTSGTYTNYTSVPNGQVWLDTDGNAIQAQGGGFLKVGSEYYWVGQDKTPSLMGLPPSESLVNLYRSSDLMNWEKVGVVLSKLTPDVDGNQLLTYCNMERPKLLYNAKTKMYVLWAHWEEHSSYDASHVITATSTNVEGPYIVTKHGHRRPGSGNIGANAMGDRVGSLIVDYNTAAKDKSDPSHPNMPYASAGYPPTIQQYSTPSATNPQIKYVDQQAYGTAQIDNWWTYQLTGVQFSMVLKAIAVNMTDFDTQYYDLYQNKYDVSAENYVVRYPTAQRSKVAMSNFTIGDPGNERKQLVAPVVGPGLSESSSTSVVYVKNGDAAFVTTSTDNSTIYYTTDGSDPRSSSNSSIYWAGTRIVMAGGSGKQLVVKAMTNLHGENSSVTTQTYEIAANPASVPIFTPIIDFPSGIYTPNSAPFGYEAMRIYSPSYGTNCYYTMDGMDPDPPNVGDNAGYGSKDMTVWQDPQNGKAFLVSAQDNVYGRLWQLNDDFTDVVPELQYDVWTAVSREAPALVRNGGKDGTFVYLATSTQSGYFPNQGAYMRAKDITAGFSLPRDKVTGYRDGSSVWSALQPFADSSTFYSQSTYIVDIGTSTAPEYIFMGDRYNTVAGYRSTFAWMPLTIKDNAPSQAGVNGSGYFQVEFTPNLIVDLSGNRLVEPPWKLLSLNKQVLATPAKELTDAQKAAGSDFSASAANDGNNFEPNRVGHPSFGGTRSIYQAVSVPYFWRVDLGAVHALSWIGLSFESTGGSDAVNRYTVSASADGEKWIELVDNTNNIMPGFDNHKLTGSFRYVQVNVFSVHDVDHNKEADWESGMYQVSVYGV